MIKYEQCPDEISRMARKLINEHYPDIKAAEVRIGYIFADSGEDGGPAVLIGGYPKLAKVRKTSQRERVQGMPDAEIIIDKAKWAELEDETKRAVMDHELYHLVPDVVEKDPAGRPRIVLRLHDIELGGFADIAKRHGEHSIEVINARAIAEAHGQLLFDFEPAGAAE